MFFHSIRFKVYKDWLSGDNLFYFYNFTILPYELSAKFCLGKIKKTAHHSFHPETINQFGKPSLFIK